MNNYACIECGNELKVDDNGRVELCKKCVEAATKKIVVEKGGK